MFIHVFNALRFMHGPSHSEEREFFFHPFSQRWTSKIWIPIHTTFCWTVMVLLLHRDIKCNLSAHFHFRENDGLMLRALAFQQRRLHNSRFFFISFVKIGFRRAKRANHTRPWGVWGESHQFDPPFSPSLYGFRLACLAAPAFLT